MLTGTFTLIPCSLYMQCPSSSKLAIYWKLEEDILLTLYREIFEKLSRGNIFVVFNNQIYSLEKIRGLQLGAVYKIKCSWVRFYSNHKNHEDISPQNFPLLWYLIIIDHQNVTHNTFPLLQYYTTTTTLHHIQHHIQLPTSISSIGAAQNSKTGFYGAYLVPCFVATVRCEQTVLRTKDLFFYCTLGIDSCDKPLEQVKWIHNYKLMHVNYSTRNVIDSMDY